MNLGGWDGAGENGAGTQCRPVFGEGKASKAGGLSQRSVVAELRARVARSIALGYKKNLSMSYENTWVGRVKGGLDRSPCRGCRGLAAPDHQSFGPERLTVCWSFSTAFSMNLARVILLNQTLITLAVLLATSTTAGTR